MTQTYNIYCDESCHLENDSQKAMVIGSIWCLKNKRLEIAKRIREIKTKHNLPSDFEIKWTKVGITKLEFYTDLVDYFFDDDDLYFRGIVIPDKATLNHHEYNQDHDDWYYKMFFVLLKTILIPQNKYNIFIDIKDTLGQEKVTKLHNVLCNNAYDFSRKIIQNVQRIQSHESDHLQLADLIIGALGYHHRQLHSSDAKLSLINRIKKRSGYSLNQNTLLKEDKFNLLIWDGRKF